MLKQLKKQDKGFTIIEVMIVLAIAGLILLIVFLAVPALQRNSRNTQRKSDIGALLAAWQEYVNNNGGTLPGAGASPAFATNAKLGYYTTPANISVVVWTANVAGPNDIDKVVFYEKGKCTVPSQTGGTANLVGAGSTRSVAATYTIEQGGGTLLDVCQDS
ncbi:MAG TPA: type II secretion system protein [Candidatus Saccharimonadales bacterium]|nr:type II secretion system protein [Candidatus Saccharimonadales bacterium]